VLTVASHQLVVRLTARNHNALAQCRRRGGVPRTKHDFRISPLIIWTSAAGAGEGLVNTPRPAIVVLHEGASLTDRS